MAATISISQRIFPVKRAFGLGAQVGSFFGSACWLSVKNSLHWMGGQPSSIFIHGYSSLVRQRLERLGPTFIKLGQIAASREDILPEIFLQELQSLYSQIPSVPFESIALTIEESLGAPMEDLFESIEEKPLGSASIGQVHRAVTFDGQTVVVKVVKPGVRELVQADITLLRRVGWCLHFLFPSVSVKTLIDEFATMILREIDLRYEAAHIEKFQENFSQYSYIRFPEVDHDLSSEDVLCMECFQGIVPNESLQDELDESVLVQIVEAGTEALVKMFFVDGFFHADLHPGNLMILEDGSLGFLDLGMVGVFDKLTRKRLLELFYAMSQKDWDETLRCLILLSRTTEESDIEGFKRKVLNLLMYADALHECTITHQILLILREAYYHRVHFPTELSLMIKALMTYEAVGQSLCPSLNMNDVAKKYVRRVYIQQYNPIELGVKILERLPTFIETFLT